jgi:hypothetical protein
MRRAVWLVLLVSWCATSARAAPRHPSLHWTRGRGAAGCIDPLTLRERIEELVGPVFEPPSDYAIEGHVEARAGGFRLRLSVTAPDRAPQGERVVEHRGSDCRAFDDALVFLIALTIDPDLELEQLTRDPSLEGNEPGAVLLRELEAKPPVPAQIEPPPVRASKAPPRRASYRWDTSLALAMGRDALPGVSLGPLIAARLPIASWFTLGADVRVLARISENDIDAARSLRAQSVSFALLGCLHAPAERTMLRLCMGAEPSVVRARGLGFDQAQRARLAVWGALGKLELVHRVHERWSVLLQTYLRIALDDKSFVEDALVQRNTVAELARWTGGIALGVAYRFGSGIDSLASTDVQSSEVRR